MAQTKITAKKIDEQAQIDPQATTNVHTTCSNHGHTPYTIAHRGHNAQVVLISYKMQRKILSK